MEANIKYSTYWAKICLHVDFSMYLKKMSTKERSLFQGEGNRMCKVTERMIHHRTLSSLGKQKKQKEETGE